MRLQSAPVQAHCAGLACTQGDSVVASHSPMPITAAVCCCGHKHRWALQSNCMCWYHSLMNIACLAAMAHAVVAVASPAQFVRCMKRCGLSACSSSCLHQWHAVSARLQQNCCQLQHLQCLVQAAFDRRLHGFFACDVHFVRHGRFLIQVNLRRQRMQCVVHIWPI